MCAVVSEKEMVTASTTASLVVSERPNANQRGVHAGIESSAHAAQKGAAQLTYPRCPMAAVYLVLLIAPSIIFVVLLVPFLLRAYLYGAWGRWRLQCQV